MNFSLEDLTIIALVFVFIVGTSVRQLSFLADHLYVFITEMARPWFRRRAGCPKFSVLYRRKTPTDYYTARKIIVLSTLTSDSGKNNDNVISILLGCCCSFYYFIVFTVIRTAEFRRRLRNTAASFHRLPIVAGLGTLRASVVFVFVFLYSRDPMPDRPPSRV